MTKPMPTKERIIDIAGHIFGKEGFKATTIRKIAEASEANIAAVNYHFRDKEGLYRAVLEDIFSKVFLKYPSVPLPEKDASHEERLYIFIHAMFCRFLGKEGWGGFSGRGKLIAREFLDPTPAFEDIVETYIRPQKNILAKILADLSREKLTPEQMFSCAVSIMGQCVYYAFAGPIVRRLSENFMPAEENIEFLSDHVFLFSLGGIQKIINDPIENNSLTHEEKHP
jgi:TetR/AcrR family transcriptional regulator, regulator of cefoperazone and chloramphenicol sensitivity